MYASTTPLTPGMNNVPSGAEKKKIRLAIPIRIFSIANLFLGLISISLQIATIILNAEYVYAETDLDYVGAGIWGGLFYIASGSLGITASVRQSKKGLLVAATVTTSIALASAITATVLASIAADQGYYYYYGNYYSCFYDLSSCEAWLGLEWALMGISVLALMNNITLISLISVPTCCGGTKHKRQVNQSPLDQPGGAVVMVNGQPVYLQPADGKHGTFVMPSTATVTPVPHQQRQPEPSYPLQLQPQQLLTVAQTEPVPSAPSPQQASNTEEKSKELHEVA